MLRVILYGGCHALIFRDLLEAVFSPSDMQVDLYINFQLIHSGVPFPLEALKSSDVFIYSPIENKESYNTDLLVDLCRANGIHFICYPWMEWHGYCPGATKGIFKGRHQWFYPKLLDVAKSFSSFEDFMDYAIARFPDEDEIDRTFLLSSEYLAAAERRHDMRIRLSEFIQDQFRRSRLFLISDHPSLALYAHALDQILAEIGLTLPKALPPREPQAAWRTPIFPRVAERLRLEFDDRQWADEALAPDRVASFETYLRLYFYGDSVVLGPRMPAGASDGSCLGVFALPTRHDTRLLATPCSYDEKTGTERYEYIDTLAGPEPCLERHQHFTIDPHLWRRTWET